MSDRTINFGESETEATYQIQDTDSTGGGNFVVAKDTNANTVLLQYDPDTDTWEYAGDVDMNGGNVSEVGTLTADSVNTEEALIKSPFGLTVNAGFDGFANIGEAVDFLEAENLTTLYVPSGDYPTEGDGVFGTGKLDITISGFTLYGDGYTSRIHSTDGDDVAMQLRAENQTVFNIRIEGEGNNGLRLDGAANSLVRSSRFDEPEGSSPALRLRGGADNCRIIGCRTTPGEGSDSLRVSSNDNVVIGNIVDDSILDQGDGNIIDNNKIL